MEKARVRCNTKELRNCGFPRNSQRMIFENKNKLELALTIFFRATLNLKKTMYYKSMDLLFT